MKPIEERKIATGFLTSDPAVDDIQIISKPVEIHHDFTINATYLKDWANLGGVLVSMHFSDIEKHSIDGSGVIIGPGMALTAKHVVEPHFIDLKSGKRKLFCTAITKNGLQIWQVSNVVFDKLTDISILSLKYCSALPPDNTFKRAIISTRLPKIGENLLILGFKATDYSFEYTDKNEMTCSGSVIACNGSVTERHVNGRDKVMLPSPCLEIDCPSWSGMSGGPVFDRNGYLIGILSTSYGADPPSFASLLWPALATPFKGGWPEGNFTSMTTLLELPEDICAIDKRTAVTITRNLQKNSMNIKYDIWEEKIVD